MLTPQLAHPHVDRGRGDGKAQPVLGQLEKSSFPCKQFIVYERLSVLRGDSLLGLHLTEQLHQEIFLAQNPLPLAHPSAIPVEIAPKISILSQPDEDRLCVILLVHLLGNPPSN